MKVVNLYKAKFDVYGGRPHGGKQPQDCAIGEEGWLGNPFSIGPDGDRAAVIRKHKSYFWKRVNSEPAFREAIGRLADKTIGCFCAPQACHCDTIAAWLAAGCPLREDAVQ